MFHASLPYCFQGIQHVSSWFSSWTLVERIQQNIHVAESLNQASKILKQY